MNDKLQRPANRLAELLGTQGLCCSTAESCTGGWVAKELTDIAGSSRWFERGFVTYSNRSKQEMLGVSEEILRSHGAVSEPVVRAMVQGALDNSRADCALAISGIAGPGGGTADKPVGTVWLAWSRRDGVTRTRSYHFEGDRDQVRRQAVSVALQGLVSLLSEAVAKGAD